MERTLNILKNAGLNYNKDIDRTVINNERRGIQIREYLKDKLNYDYVVIDDELHDFKETIDFSKVIKTDVMKGALSIKMVDNYFKKQSNTHKLNKK